MKSKLTCYATGDGQYLMDAAGRYGVGYQARVIGTTPAEAATALRMEIRQFIGSNPEGGEFTAPPEVLEAMESGTVDGAPVRGARISYYASPEALQVIQARREATGDSQSGAINALVVAGLRGNEAAIESTREACAKVCDEIAEHYGQDGGEVADHCAITIRAL